MTSSRARASTAVELLVVGGGPAALSAAIGYRDAGGRGRVLLVSDEDVLPYTRPSLSKDYLRGQSVEDGLTIKTAEDLRARSIDVQLGVAVNTLLAVDRQAVLSDGHRVGYTHCVLATGATPRTLPVPGADDPSIIMLRSLRNARTLLSAAERSSSAIVIGSGFVGCEAAASLARLGLAVTVISEEELPQQTRLGPAVGANLAGWLGEEGVTLLGDRRVSAIENGRRVAVSGGSALEADLLLVASGMRPNAQLAIDAGARIADGRVVVDEYMHSSVPGLFAAGDVVYAYNPTAARHLAVEHWGEALEMGTIAGANAAGANRGWTQTPGFWSTIGDHTLKCATWGDGFDEVRLHNRDKDTNSFTAWYSHRGTLVGVATHNADDDYEEGMRLIAQGVPVTTVT